MRLVQPGQRIGKYVLAERIAVGGMAEVWAARVEGPQGFVKPLALKFMLESFAGDTELERLFVNEARVAAQLQHANIVSIFDFDKVDAAQGGGLAGRYYIAMERVEGRDLRQIALGAQRAGQPFPRSLALFVAGEVLKGLRYVHERRENRRPLGLIHRDVSPHNVLVSYGGEVKLSDFGIAKARASSTSGKATGNIRGKLAYASPEQLEDLALDHRTDQFALGVTLWELLAGRRLFDGADELEVMTKVSRCEIPPFSSLAATRDIAPAIEAVVRRMLYRRIEDRFPTTAEALAAVLSLPGYSADGMPLGNLVKRLFLTQTDFPVTGPLATPIAPPAAAPVSSLPATQTILPPRKTPTPLEPGTRSVGTGATPASRPPSHRARAGTRLRLALVAAALVLAAGAAGIWVARDRAEDAATEETDPPARAPEDGRLVGVPLQPPLAPPVVDGVPLPETPGTPALGPVSPPGVDAHAGETSSARPPSPAPPPSPMTGPVMAPTTGPVMGPLMGPVVGPQPLPQSSPDAPPASGPAPPPSGHDHAPANAAPIIE
ncbi:MAG TPA: serine/threonine-protein kinase [Polyangia bacterium]|nr:serine/threonine-protein kinase [Polyangia bacterium]